MPAVAFNTAIAFVSLAAGIWVTLRSRAIIEAVPGSERVESKVLLGFIAALGLLYLAGGITYRMGVSFANSAQWVSDTQRVRAALGDLYAAVSDAEAGGARLSASRAAPITSRSEYERVICRISRARALGHAARDVRGRTPCSFARLQVLESSIEGRLDALSRQLEAFDRQGQVAGATRLLRATRGIQLAQVNATPIVQLMDLSESKLLTARTEELSRNRGLTLFALIATLAIATTTALVLLFNSITL